FTFPSTIFSAPSAGISLPDGGGRCPVGGGASGLCAKASATNTFAEAATAIAMSILLSNAIVSLLFASVSGFRVRPDMAGKDAASGLRSRASWSGLRPNGPRSLQREEPTKPRSCSSRRRRVDSRQEAQLMSDTLTTTHQPMEAIHIDDKPWETL